MTKNQFRKKIDIARDHGIVNLDDDTKLIYHGGTMGWSLINSNGVIDTSYTPLNFMYICE